MKNEIKVELNIKDEEKTQKLMARAVADIIRMRVEKMPEHLRIKAYDMLIESIKSMKWLLL